MKIKSLMSVTLDELLNNVTEVSPACYIEITGMTDNQCHLVADEVPCVTCDNMTLVIPGRLYKEVQNLFK